MAKIRIHELAKELDKQSKEIQSFLQGQGIEVKSASSSVEENVAESVRKAFGKSQEKPEKVPEAPVKAAPREGGAAPAPNKPAKSPQETPKKKKTIIFVNNSQNSQSSKPSGQRYGQGGNGGRPQDGQRRPQGGNGNKGYGDRRNQSAAPVRTPIKPLTPPSPTPNNMSA